MTGHTPWAELRAIPHKRWYQFGLRSPEVLWGRFHRRHRPIWRTRMMWQRAQRGWSVEDTWSLSNHLENVIIGAVSYWRNLPPHSYPATPGPDGEPTADSISYEQWLQVLDEIIVGMKAAQHVSEEGDWAEGGEEAFQKAMQNMTIYWHHLWD